MEQASQEPDTFVIDGIPYQARREPDLSWLRPYGTVFRVLDQQFSGNLCFFVNGPYGKLFIKYAGAETINYRGRTVDAVLVLQRAMPLYEYQHPALTRLLAHGPAGDGYAAIYVWRDAQPLRGIPFDPSVREGVRRQPLAVSLKMLDMVIDAHAYLTQNGIIAVDFHDGNVLIDFGRKEAVVCDLDLYRKKPAMNDRGRMWGSSRFMAPEEYTLGASLDETTTAYNLAALAFEFFGNNEERTIKSWIGPLPLFEVAAKATRDSKADRYPSMRAFQEAWREAVGRCSI